MSFLLPFTKARSFPEDNLKYYCDIIKMHDNSDNVVYLDSEDDTNCSEDLKHRACDIDMLNEDDDFPINDHHLILNENENVQLDDGRIQVYNVHHNTNSLDEIADIKFQTEPFTFKRAAENELESSPGAKRIKDTENDADLSFLKSLLPDMKTMDGGQKRKFKINVLKLMDEILDSPAPGTSKSGAGFRLS